MLTYEDCRHEIPVLYAYACSHSIVIPPSPPQLLATPTHPALSARAPRESATPGRPQSSAPPPSPSPGHRLATWRCSGLLLRPAPLFPGCHVPPAWLAGWTDPRDGTALLLQLAEAARPLLTAAAAADAGAMAAAARGGGGGTAAGVPDIDRVGLAGPRLQRSDCRGAGMCAAGGLTPRPLPAIGSLYAWISTSSSPSSVTTHVVNLLWFLNGLYSCP